MAGRRTRTHPRPDVRQDPALQALLTPPTADELARLRESLLTEGCREPLAVWAQHGLLLDGYARHAICTDHDIRFEVRLIELPDRDAAIRWRLSAQLQRRNLSPFQASWVRGQLYSSLKRKPGRPRKGEKPGQNAPVSTDDELAARWGVDARTVRRDAAFAAALGVIQDRMGIAYRDRILTREYPLTRTQVVDWGRDLKARTIDEGELQRLVEQILESRRKTAEKKRGDHLETSEDSSHGDEAGDLTPGGGPPADTPLVQLYEAWDMLTAAWSAAGDDERATFRAVPSVPELAAELLGEQAGERPAGGRVRR